MPENVSVRWIEAEDLSACSAVKPAIIPNYIHEALAFKPSLPQLHPTCAIEGQNRSFDAHVDCLRAYHDVSL